jgi:hypothetical protein
VVLMGGVGMQGGAGLDLPYPWMMRNCITLRRQWMYLPHAATLMAGLVRSGWSISVISRSPLSAATAPTRRSRTPPTAVPSE